MSNGQVIHVLIWLQMSKKKKKCLLSVFWMSFCYLKVISEYENSNKNFNLFVGRHHNESKIFVDDIQNVNIIKTHTPA